MLRTHRVDTLDALKTMMLRNMGGVGTNEVGRIAYRFLYALPNDGFTNRLFWIDGDQHVRVMFDVHARLMPQHVMELYSVVRDAVVGDWSSPLGPEVVPLEAIPINYAQPYDSADDSDSKGDSTYVAGSESSSDTVSDDEFVLETPSGSDGQIHSQRLLAAIDKNRENLPMLRVTHCDRRVSVFSVEEMEPVDGWSQTSYQVCLTERTCDCGLFQSLHYPCRHALAACAAASIEWGHFVDPVYTMASVFKVY
ncbi:hypothetical protein Ahy_B05g074254 [Arachis hypogaea]|uniref:SWIM-type domain-containing protein n=1 Tax=Arachis hypogaea TaxID=3818 RepID=A0A444YYF6_ARAHY|nr:hypothetical protein Ahy_B05g074254 [Arachis hypogaea]